MTTSRRIRPAADIAVGYAADAQGNGIAFAAIATGTATATVRLTFAAPPQPALEGREMGYAAVAALARHLKGRGIGRARIRLADAHVVAELGGGSPPKALAMAYVRVRCLLYGLGFARLECAEPVEVRDLVARASAEVRVRVAA